jgi:hypothetical protein
MIGQRFNRLTVIANAPMQGGRGMILCRCACGAEKVIEARRVRKGLTKSCGCLQRDISKSRNRRKKSMPACNPLDLVDEDIMR